MWLLLLVSLWGWTLGLLISFVASSIILVTYWSSILLLDYLVLPCLSRIEKLLQRASNGSRSRK